MIDETKERLEVMVGSALEIKVNQNRSTLISSRPNMKGYVLSLHEVFIDAPDPILSAVADLVKGKRMRAARTIIRDWHDGKGSPGRPRPFPIDLVGRYHDLTTLYHEVNLEYFEERLDLQITWFGEFTRRRRGHMIMGEYDATRRLVKIHRRLDSRKYPTDYVRFIIYHEMLHHVHPPISVGNRRLVHSPEFRASERLFAEYEAICKCEERMGLRGHQRD